MRWATVLLLALAGCATMDTRTYYKPGGAEFDKHYDVFQCQRFEAANTTEKERACMAGKGWTYR